MHALTALKLIVLLGLTWISNVTMAQVGNNESVLNPNLADESQLAAAPGLNAEVAANIIAARPLANNLELDALLGGSLDIKIRSARPIRERPFEFTQSL